MDGLKIFFRWAFLSTLFHVRVIFVAEATSLQPAGADFVTVCASRFPVLAPCVQIPADTLPPFVDASVCLRLMSNLVCFGLSEEYVQFVLSLSAPLCTFLVRRLAATLFSPAEAEILYSNRYFTFPFFRRF